MQAMFPPKIFQISKGGGRCKQCFPPRFFQISGGGGDAQLKVFPPTGHATPHNIPLPSVDLNDGRGAGGLGRVKGAGPWDTGRGGLREGGGSGCQRYVLLFVTTLIDQ